MNDIESREDLTARLASEHLADITFMAKARAMEQTGKAIAGVGCVMFGLIFFGAFAVMGIALAISMAFAD